MTLPTAPGVGRRSVGEAGVLIVPDAHGRQEQDGDRHSCAGRRPVCRPAGARPHPVAPRPPESDRPRPIRGRRRMTRRSPEGPGVRPPGHAPPVSGPLPAPRRRPRRCLGAVCQNGETRRTCDDPEDGRDDNFRRGLLKFRRGLLKFRRGLLKFRRGHLKFRRGLLKFRRGHLNAI